MWRRCGVHSSLCSRSMAPTSRVMARLLGKMPTTLVLRMISAFSRSSGLVERICSQCPRGKSMQDNTSCSTLSIMCMRPAESR